MPAFPVPADRFGVEALLARRFLALEPCLFLTPPSFLGELGLAFPTRLGELGIEGALLFREPFALDLGRAGIASLCGIYRASILARRCPSSID